MGEIWRMMAVFGNFSGKETNLAKQVGKVLKLKEKT